MRPSLVFPRRSGVILHVIPPSRVSFHMSPLLVALALALMGVPLPAQSQPMAGVNTGAMPDLSAMSGKPLPDRGMALGTVTVRVARQTPANPVPNAEITALVEAPGGETRKRTAKTDATGRALFDALSVGHRFHAEIVVDGEKLSTETFPVPDVGGVRTMLIAGLGKAGGKAAGPGAAGPGAAGGDKGQPFSLGFISGAAQPAPELPAGSVQVLALDENGRPLAGKTIELGYIRAGGQVEVARQVTDADGITRFANIGGRAAKVAGAAGGSSGAPTGDIGAAVVMQHGEMRLGSDGFTLPTTAGVKVDLRVPIRTADPSIITIGAGGRVILQLRDETVSFIETLPLENHSDKLFDPGPGGVEIPLPTEFINAEGAEGEHKIEIRKGIGIAVHGPIPPRRPQVPDPNRKSPDEVTFGFLLPATGSTRDFVQRFPNGLGEFTFITDQLPGLTIDSQQISGRQDREVGGKKYWLMRGAAVPPGGTLRFKVRGLPAPDNTGRVVSGSLALALVGTSILFGRRRPNRDGREGPGERDRLVQRREKLFSELLAMETRETPDAGDRTGRAEVVQKLEAIYREIAVLDERHAV